MMLTVTSFGHLHRKPPKAHIYEDVRKKFRDPARVRGFLDKNGLDHQVRDLVLSTPGVVEFLNDLSSQVKKQAKLTRTVRVVIGCAGGKHRAPALAEALAQHFEGLGWEVVVAHLDVHKPRVLEERKRGV